MKITVKAQKDRALHLKQLKVRVPKDFPWKLMGKIQDDLGLSSTNPLFEGAYSDRAREIAHMFTIAQRSKSLDLLNSAIAEASPQSIVSWAGTAYEMFAVNQLGALLKKFPFSSGEATAIAAIKKFAFYERECHRFNTSNFKALIAIDEKHPDFLGVIDEIRSDILRLIGSVPNVSRVYDCAKHGPGTAVGKGFEKGAVTSYFKWSSVPYSVSPAARPYALEAIERDPRWIGALLNKYRVEHGIPMYAPIDMELFWESTFELVDYCKYSSVPKTALTDRSIAIEPTLNVFLQLGVDGLIRSRLKRRWKIDLNTQELNQELAYKSSLDDELVTLDLEGASETVSLKACELVLPEGWFSLLWDLRSRNIRLPDETIVPLAKISAMGNGFTFALESLIFAALARCAMRRTKTRGSLAVYGDDIILPRVAYQYLRTLLDLFGFKVNVDKTFVSGPFRESCGADFFRGHNVRPFFCKLNPKLVTDIFYIHNFLWSLERNLNWAWDVQFSSTLRWLRKYVPKQFRTFTGPPSETLDGYIFSDRPHYSPNKWNQKTFQTITPMAKKYNGNTDFFFRKLMVQLKAGSETPLNKWDKRLNTGNAFDVTRRDRVRYYLTPKVAW